MRLVPALLMFGIGTSCAINEGPQHSSAEQHGVSDPQDLPAYEGCIAAGYSPIEWPAGTGQWICPCPGHTNQHPFFVAIMEGGDATTYRDHIIRFCNHLMPEEPEDPGATTD